MVTHGIPVTHGNSWYFLVPFVSSAYNLHVLFIWWCASAFHRPSSRLFEFSLSQTPQCHQSCFKLLLHDQWNPGQQLRATQSTLQRILTPFLRLAISRCVSISSTSVGRQVGRSIPDNCYGHHGRCPCKKYSVRCKNFSRLNTKTAYTLLFRDICECFRLFFFLFNFRV